MLYKHKLMLVIFTLITLVLVGDAGASDSLKARGEINWRYSNDRSIMMSEFWIPIAQNPNDGSVLFADMRFMGDNNENREFNLGAGYRQLIDTELFGEGIAGGLVWFDRRKTQLDSKFNQVTLGGEWLADQYDVRVNAYIPLNKDKTSTRTNPNGTGVGFVGNQLFVNTDQLVVEEALPGLDFELGYKLDFADHYTDSTRVYAGAYHFEGNQAEDVTGWRARIAGNISSDIQLGARYQHDDVRGSQTYLEATVRFPFGAKQSYGSAQLKSRLDESPERDIDIVSNEKVLDAGLNQNIINVQTGVAQNIIHVDNSAGGGGDGSAENPFNALVAAETAAVANDMIYVHRGDGTTTGQNAGITLDDSGQILAGSGSALMFDASRFRATNGLVPFDNNIIEADSDAPVITNTAAEGVNVTADDVILSGFTVDGAFDEGILVENANNFNANSIQVTNSGTNGLELRYSDNASHFYLISNSDFSGNTNNGIVSTVINATTLNANIANNTTNNNLANGIALRGIDFSTSSYNASNNFAFNNDDVNLRYSISDNAISETVLENNILDQTGTAAGILLRVNGDANLTSAMIKGNTISNSSANGITVDTALGVNAVIDNINIFENNIFDNSGAGIVINTNTGTSTRINNVIIDNNQIYDNDSSGLVLSATNASAISASASKNQIYNNGNYGIRITDDSSTSISADLGGGAFGSVGLNSIYGNSNDAVSLDLDGGQLKAENNFWGNINGLQSGDVDLDGATTIDATPFLSRDPNL